MNSSVTEKKARFARKPLSARLAAELAGGEYQVAAAVRLLDEG